MINKDVTDYQNFSTKDMLKKERSKLNIGDIWSNAAKCLLCGETIRSKNRHDFRSCSCGNLMVDGGSCYTRRGFKGSVDSFEDCSELYNDVKDTQNEN